MSNEEYEVLRSNFATQKSRDLWSFQDETIKYLHNDLNCLYEILDKANNYIFNEYKINLTECITISGLAMKIYLKNYYNCDIPMINKSKLYNDIKEAYYGGITEVYKPYGTNLYYYDVNSLYPYVAYQAMAGLECKHMISYVNRNIQDLFGLCEAPKNAYLGLLPLREVLYFQ